MTVDLARVALIALLGAVVAALLSPALSQAGQPMYEPNDSMATATGPLAVSSAYEASLETENDKDYFYFYVTSPTTAQVQLTYKTIGEKDWFTAHLLDSHGGTVKESWIEGPYEIASVTLSAGKYYVEISNGGTGQGYRIETQGTDGAFGSFATIQSNCAAAQGAANVQQELVNSDAAAVTKAKERRRRALAHMHRVERHGSLKARKKVRRNFGHAESAYRAAAAALKEAEKALKGAIGLESPWCFIPQ